MPRHLLSLHDFKSDEIDHIFSRTKALKELQKSGRPHKSLEGKTLGMVFEKSSTRTRVSFEVGMFQLGGHALNLTTQASQLGRGETYEDTAKVLSRYVDIIMMRTFEQERVVRMASGSRVPVINGLSDLLHPCQVMADIFTVIEHCGPIREQKISYVGDGNNMANTWIEAAEILGFELRIATPKGFECDPAIVARVKGSKNIIITNDPKEGVAGCNVINTDTWVSMGQEGKDEAEKKRLFAPFQVNSKLMSIAAKNAIALHCLPAHRNEEITDEVIDGPQSRVFDEAENRLHVQKAIMEFLYSVPSK